MRFSFVILDPQETISEKKKKIINMLVSPVMLFRYVYGLPPPHETDSLTFVTL